MKSNKQPYFRGVLLAALGWLAVHNGVLAEPSAYRNELTGQALRGALAMRPVALLEAVPPAGGRDARMKELLQLLGDGRDRRIRVSDPGRAEAGDKATTLLAADDSWYLRVSGDGSSFTYRGDIDNSKEIRAAGTRQLDSASLERLGRDFIARRLARVAPLGDGEKLVFMGSKYLREGSATEDDPRFGTQVVANVAIFSREVQGTFVGGPGSKIAVWFADNGEPVGFDVDWPVYRDTGKLQDTLGIDGVWQRLGEYGDHPLDLVRANLKRFECGYVDLGAHKRNGTPIQAGCFLHHTGEMASEFTYAAVEIVPIGHEVVADPAWPASVRIANNDPATEACRFTRTGCQEPPSVE